MLCLGQTHSYRLYFELRRIKVNTASKKNIQIILEKYKLAPLKKFGQNFLADGNIVSKIADSMHLTKDDCVLEVGPGLGALTLALAARAGKVLAVEIDKGMIEALKEILTDSPNVTVIEGDILKTDIRQIAAEQLNDSFHACGNLPYYITAPCILTLIESGAKSLTAMVQKEVAERLSSPPGNKNYGSLTASVSYYAKPETLFTVGKNCFFPSPDVDSAIVRMELDRQPYPVSREWYTRIVRASFAMRRKTVYNNLISEFGKSPDGKELIVEALHACRLNPSVRAEDLSPEDFYHLSEFFSKRTV